MERNMVGKASRRKPEEPTRVSVTNAADKLGELVGKVAEGQTIILTKYNLPVARLVPLDDAA
jgi:prevent-host-death family protein